MRAVPVIRLCKRIQRVLINLRNRPRVAETACDRAWAREEWSYYEFHRRNENNGAVFTPTRTGREPLRFRLLCKEINSWDGLS